MASTARRRMLREDGDARRRSSAGESRSLAIRRSGLPCGEPMTVLRESKGVTLPVTPGGQKAEVVARVEGCKEVRVARATSKHDTQRQLASPCAFMPVLAPLGAHKAAAGQDHGQGTSRQQNDLTCRPWLLRRSAGPPSRPGFGLPLLGSAAPALHKSCLLILVPRPPHPRPQVRSPSSSPPSSSSSLTAELRSCSCSSTTHPRYRFSLQKATEGATAQWAAWVRAGLKRAKAAPRACAARRARAALLRSAPGSMPSPSRRWRVEGATPSRKKPAPSGSLDP